MRESRARHVGGEFEDHAATFVPPQVSGAMFVTLSLRELVNVRERDLGTKRNSLTIILGYPCGNCALFVAPWP